MMMIIAHDYVRWTFNYPDNVRMMELLQQFYLSECRPINSYLKK